MRINNRKLRLAIVIFSVLVITISAQYIWDTRQIAGVLNPQTSFEGLTQYEINMEFIEEDMHINASQSIEYINTTGKTLNNIYLHLYPNVFKERTTAPFEKREMDRAYPNGFDPGYIEIKNIKAEKMSIDHRVMGEVNTILRITPAKPLKPGDTINLVIDFMVKLPNTIGRMGYGENTVNITNWFPIVAVYDDHGWNLDPYYAIGDPFYSDVAQYRVKATIPEAYIMAATGDVIKVQEKESKKIYELEGNLVRNFVIILSKEFDVEEVVLDDTRIISYTLRGTKEKEALQYGLDSLKIFNDLFGKYPYNQLSIVASDFFIGGMEYPNVVMISQGLYEMQEDFPLEYVIVHEVAHQWWYGIVGNNEIKEPWLDEALTEYSTLMYFEKKYGPHIKEQIYEKMVKAQYENYIDFEPDQGERILRSLREFDSSWQYSSIVYSKGAMFIEKLREEMGEEAFLRAIREYFKTYSFKNATTEDFYRICEKNTEEDINYLFNQWLNANM